MRTKKQSGFTLIELLVVIAIIALLASIVLVALGSARSKSRDAKRIGDVRQLGTALELYYNDNNAYPSALSGLAPSYIGAVPTAPTPPDGSCNTGNNAYTYTQTGSGSGYTLAFCVGGATGGLAAGTHSESTNGIQ
jgi:prepilin-type N-terminal cleavage/methylation domain-containing protein